MNNESLDKLAAGSSSDSAFVDDDNDRKDTVVFVAVQRHTLDGRKDKRVVTVSRRWSILLTRSENLLDVRCGKNKCEKNLLVVFFHRRREIRTGRDSRIVSFI